MNELFLVNVNYDVTGNYPSWVCQKATHSLSEASAWAEEIRLDNWEVKVQSILINDKGYVEDTPWRWEPKQKENV